MPTECLFNETLKKIKKKAYKIVIKIKKDNMPK